MSVGVLLVEASWQSDLGIVLSYESQLYSTEDYLTTDNYQSHAEDGHNDEESH